MTRRARQRKPKVLHSDYKSTPGLRIGPSILACGQKQIVCDGLQAGFTADWLEFSRRPADTISDRGAKQSGLTHELDPISRTAYGWLARRRQWLKAKSRPSARC